MLPLKPLTPCRVIMVVESESPAEMLMLAWLRVEANPVGPTCILTTAKWTMPLNRPVAVTLELKSPLVIELHDSVSDPIRAVVRSTEWGEAEDNVQGPVTVSVRRSENAPNAA